MIYSAVSLLFSLAANSFDLAQIPPARSSSPSISPRRGHCRHLYVTPLMENRAKEWKRVGADKRRWVGGVCGWWGSYYSDF